MGENICKPSTRKKFTFKVYKEIIHTMSKEQIIQLKIWTKELNRHFSKKTYKWPTGT